MIRALSAASASSAPSTCLSGALPFGQPSRPSASLPRRSPSLPLPGAGPPRRGGPCLTCCTRPLFWPTHGE
eukprot:6798222-Alexandrium_andersonii.AAC.1